MNLSLKKTNSWHWLAIALIHGIAFSYCGWRACLDRVETQCLPQIAKEEQHLIQLKAMDAFEPDRLDRETKRLEQQLDTLQKRLDQAGTKPIPQGKDAVVVIKNSIDQALGHHQLQVAKCNLSLSLSTQDLSREASPKAIPQPRPVQQKVPRLSQEEFILSYDLDKMLASYEQIPDKALRKQMVQEEKRRSHRILAQQAKLRAQGVTIKAKANPARVVQAPVKPTFKPNLPFKTVEINYVVRGDFRQMFLFLVKQSFLKQSYHFKQIQVVQFDDGEMGMAFVLQVNYL